MCRKKADRRPLIKHSCESLVNSSAMAYPISIINESIFFLPHKLPYQPCSLSITKENITSVKANKINISKKVSASPGVVGWCDGPWYTSNAGASYNLDDSRARPIALAVGAGGGLDIFTSSIFSLLFLPLFGRRPDINCNTVSKGRLTQNNQPTKISA